MALYAIGDLHLSLSSNKPMDVFGQIWNNYVDKIRDGFTALNSDDVIVICGDISWGMSLEESLLDFRFIDALPGHKIILKGNHDYWWNTVRKMNEFFRINNIRSIELLHNNSFEYKGFSLCGTRGWFYELDQEGSHNELVYKRELGRLETSFLDAKFDNRICFLHYPPLYQGYRCPEILDLLKKYRVNSCYYGHLHGLSVSKAINGIHENIDFQLVSSDFLSFQPKKIID